MISSLKFIFMYQTKNKLIKEASVPGNFDKYPIPNKVEKKIDRLFISSM